MKSLNEFSPEGYVETDVTNGRGEPRETFDASKYLFGFTAMALLLIVVACSWAYSVHRHDGDADRLATAETENAGLLSRNQELNSENERLRKDHIDMRSKLVGARIRVRDLERYIDEQKRIHDPQPDPIPNGEAL